MSTLEGLLAGIVSEPLEETRWLVLADWLEENDDPRRAELLRLHRYLLATCCEPKKHKKERRSWQSRIVELIGQGVIPCVPQERVLLGDGVEMVFSFIPGGEFLMGSESKEASNDEKPVHRVKLTKGFFLGIYPVTQSQWKAVMGTEPSYFKGDDRPVETVSWTDSKKFCKKLTAKLKSRGTVRLPTEAEWEYACRAGTTTEYSSGEGEAALKKVGWFAGNEGAETHPVGQLAANAWNLHDLHGNTWEWCNDWYENYSSEQKNDSSGPASGSSRVNRGGSWDFPAGLCRSACRDYGDPTFRDDYLGFRVALVLPGS